jgi:hypothetical protein
MCGSGCSRGQPGHPASRDPTPVAADGEAEEEWKWGGNGKRASCQNSTRTMEIAVISLRDAITAGKRRLQRHEVD